MNAPATANSMQITEVALLGVVVPADVTQPGDPIVATSNNSPGSEGVANAIDDTQAKYLNFDITNTGFTVTPSVGATIVTGIGLESGNDAPERDPSTYILSGSTDGTNFVVISSGAVPLFSGRYTEQVFFFTNATAYKVYKVIFPTVVNAPTSANSMQITEVELFGSVAPQNVLQPGDPIYATSNNSPGSEGVANAIDGTQAKYLNFDITNTGFTVTPSVGATIVTGIGLESGNDAPERDPSSYIVYGSTDGTNFVVISSNSVPLFSGRYTEQDFFFPNSAKYTVYRVIFPTVVNAPTAANSMQITEVKLFGFAAGSSSLPQFKTQPIDTPSLLGSSAFFFVVVNGPWQIQWYSNSVAIPGATQLGYTTAPATNANNGDVYYAIAKNGSLTSQSDSAHLRIFTPSTTESIGASWIGGGANGSPTSMFFDDITGVWKQAYWNNLTNSPAGPLQDSSNNTSAVTITWTSSGSWGSGVGTATPDDRLLNGLLDSNNNATGDNVVFDQLDLSATYSLIAYSIGRPLEFENADFTVTAGNRTNTVYIRTQESGEYKAAPGWLRGTSTNSNQRDVANYVRFDNLKADTLNELTLQVTPQRVAVYQAALNGIQLLVNPPAAGNPPSVTTQPANANLVAGANATFSVTVSGDAPFTYQWRENGASIANGGSISGATTSTLTISGMTAANAGQYSVYVANAAGSLVSQPAVLTIYNGSITDRLVAHWTFDDKTGMTASNSIAGGGAGALQGYVDNSSWTNGQIGGALHFDGNAQWVDVESFAKPSNSVSISAWVWDDGTANADNSSPTIIANPGARISSGLDLIPFDLNLDITADPLGRLQGLISSGPNNYGSEEGTNLASGVWHHVVTVADGAHLALYHNGVLVANSSYSGNIEAAAALCLGIGGYEDVTNCGSLNVSSAHRNGLWVGMIDDVGLWVRALGANEVQAVYQAGLAGKDLSKAVVTVGPTGPTMSISIVSGKVTISWTATGVTLQSSASLSAKNWQAVTGVTGNSYTVPTLTAAAFYRLKQ